MFDNDLINKITDVLLQGINIVLLIDANENVETGTFASRMEEIGMMNAFTTLFEESMPPTHHSGSQPISTMYHSSNLNIVNGGIYPRDVASKRIIATCSLMLMKTLSLEQLCLQFLLLLCRDSSSTTRVFIGDSIKKSRNIWKQITSRTN